MFTNIDRIQIDNFRLEKEKIKKSVKLSDVIRAYGTELIQSGKELKGLCPFHIETRPSFHVYEDTQSYFCFACKAAGDVFEFLCEKNGISFKQAYEYLGGRFKKTHADPSSPQFPVKHEKSPVLIDTYEYLPEFHTCKIWNKTRNHYNSIVADNVYTYHDDEHRAVGQILRIKRKDGTKTILPCAMYEHEKDGLVWAFGAMPTPHPLYNLRDIMAYPDKPVLIVEGEKCVDLAKGILDNFVVTTWVGGAGGASKTDWRCLERREVYIWPDNDSPGKAAANRIAADLFYAEIVVPNRKWKKGWDIADEIAKGTTKDKLTDYILSFKVISPEEEAEVCEFALPPGLLGDLTRYILDSSSVRQPILAIGASITIMSLLMAQKCMTEDKINPNIYVLTLAPSGSGKSFPLKQISHILNAIGAGHLLSNKPASGPGLISAMHKRRGRLLCAIDEFGAVFSSIMSADSGSYQRDIVTKMLQMFNLSDSQYNDEEGSDRQRAQEVRTIYKPHLIIYGTTVPDNFYTAVNADDAVNGFLARLLVLQGVDPKARHRPAAEIATEMPDDLLHSLKNWAYDPVNLWGDHNPDHYDFAPIKIPFEQEARKLLHAFRDECSQIAIEAEGKGDKFKESLYRRSFEMVSKLALLARNESTYIDRNAVAWAINLVKVSTARYHKEAVNYISDGLFSKKSKEVERYLKLLGKWVTRQEIFNKFRVKPREIEEILEYLLQAGILEMKSQAKKPETTDKRLVCLYRYCY